MYSENISEEVLEISNKNLAEKKIGYLIQRV